ncbi:MAG: tetratricopeptide repeat protein [Planctomycetia bacterium]|nr:tetratricopeptide repeat protein [Planctomycetia bacterium]
MGLFDAPSRSTVRDPGDNYRVRADRLADETRRLFTTGRLTDAEERVRELIDLQTNVVGERHPEYANGLCLLADILSAQDELSDAETLIQRASEIRKKALGERHPDYATSLDQMGKLLLRWEDVPGAEY